MKYPTQVKEILETAHKNYNKSETTNKIDHPEYYGGESNVYECIKVIEAWDLGFHLGNAVKYINRAGKKSADPVQDLKKAIWYIERFINKK